MLRTRVITAVTLIALFLGALFYLPEAGWRLFTFVIVLVALWEWTRIAQFKGAKAWGFLAASLVLGLMLFHALADETGALPWWREAASVAFAVASLFWIIIVPLWLRFGWRPRQAWMLALTGWVVIFPTWCALVLHRETSPWYLLALMALVWVADIAAYFAGRAFGRHKLAPSVSPGKTWEGVAGAMAGVLAYAALCQWLLSQYGDGKVQVAAHSWPAVILSFSALTALSVLGDLFESWMKRGAGLKDSSNLLPGHGGVLDRVDALTSTLPVAPFIFLVAAKLLPT
jgi:phosphatidate cytidylyltransferase